MKITSIEQLEEIFDADSGKWNGDNAVQGLAIIGKYFDTSKESIIQGAGHDVIWSVNCEDIIEKGFTEKDAIALRDLNWMIEDGSYFACFV